MENERGLWFLRPVMQWEDEERASWGLEEMRAEFKKRLYKETNMITLKPANSGGYRVIFGDIAHIGDIICTPGAGYSWLISENPGYLTSDILRGVAAELDKLNERYRRKMCGPSTEVVGRDYVPPTDLSQEPF